MSTRTRRWNPSHLWKSRHGTYFFRFVIPPAVRSQHPGLPREIRRSLKTDSWRTAITAARHFRVEVEKWLVTYGMYTTRKSTSPGIYACYMGLSLPLPDGRLVNISIERDTPEEEARAAAEIAASWPTLATKPTPAPAPAPAAPAADPLTWHRLSELFLKSKLETGAIDEKSRDQYRASLELLGGFFEGKDAKEIDWTDAESLLGKLKRYPSNASKRFPGKSVAVLLDMDNAAPYLSVGTINSLLTRASSMCKWAARRNLLARNPFEETQCKDTRSDNELRVDYSEGDLRHLFTTIAHNAKKPFQFWLPLLALYSGARQNELAQLRVTDILNVEGVPAISICKLEGESDKRLKTASAKRMVPLHSALIALGFLDFVEAQRRRRHVRLFPELVEQRDGYGQMVSKWFNRTLLPMVPFANGTNAKRDFHSLRHTFVTALKHAKVDETLLAELAGHHVESITVGRYGKRFPPTVTQPAVELAQFDIPRQALADRWEQIRRGTAVNRRAG